MNVLSESLTNLKIGDARTFAGLTVFPLFAADGAPTRERGYLTLDEALAAGTVSITEVGEAGRVPELCLQNDGDRPVLLLDGEELVGAKQNRVLNLTVLAPAGKTIVIPVSCVEQGRWRRESVAFETESHVMMPNVRRSKAGHVSRSLAAGGMARSDQGAVWAEVASASHRYGATSDTGAMREIYRRHGRSLDEFVAAFPPEEGQVGAVFAVEGEVRGAEAFDHHAVLTNLLPKVVRSWALEAIDAQPRAHVVPTRETARAFLDLVGRAGLREHDGVGLGRDMRFDDRRITGGALLQDGATVHLCAFRSEEDVAGGPAVGHDGTRHGGRIASPGYRRRRR